MSTISDSWEILGQALIGQLPSPHQVISLLVGIVFETDDTIPRLNAIEEKLTLLMSSYLSSARDFLNDALLTDSEASRREYLNDARRFFVQASNLSVPPESLRAQEYVGICHTLLGDKLPANNWFKKCFVNLCEYCKPMYLYANKCENGYVKFFKEIAPLLPLAGAGLDVQLNTTYINTLINLFYTEKQIIHLWKLLKNDETVVEKPPTFFGEDIAAIAKKYISTRKAGKGTAQLKIGDIYMLECYDRNGNIV